MSRCCTLLNPSTKTLGLIRQRSALSCIAGNLVTPPPNHKCMVNISVNLDSLEQSLKNLPETFCFKVNVNIDDSENAMPTSSINVEDYKSVTELNEVSRAIMKQHLCDQAICSVVDLDCAQLTTPEYMRKFALLLSETPKLIIFTIGSKHRDRLTQWRTEINLDVVLLQYVDPDDILRILSNSNKHLLTGCLLGWWGATLSQSTDTVCPDPWNLGSTTIPNPKWQYVPCHWSYSKYFDKVYYINLDRRTDRRAHMDEQLNKFHMTATRISAVDGNTLKWKPEYGVMSDYWNNGAFAYCLSYRVAIIDAIKTGLDSILVLDDDAVFTDNLFEVLENAKKELPEEWHMLYFGANHHSPISMPTERERVGNYLYRLIGSMGSHGIILHKSCFKTVLNFLTSPYAPLDIFFSMYQKFFPCYITYPGVAYQRAGHSDILNKEVNYTSDWNIDYIHHIKGRN
jgi:glycosyl transferase, family 25